MTISDFDLPMMVGLSIINGEPCPCCRQKEGAMCGCRATVQELTRLRAELDRLDSWDGLMELLDRRWPEHLFPTMYGDDPRRDQGARIVSLLRWVNKLRR